MRFIYFFLAASFVCTSCQQQPAPPATETTSTPEYLSPESYANFPLSEAVVHGDMIYLSGKLGTTPEGLVEGGITPETRQTMENIASALEKYGSSMDRVVKCLVMLATIDEWPDMNEVYKEYFPTNKPARSAIGGLELALGARVEIECAATID